MKLKSIAYARCKKDSPSFSSGTEYRIIEVDEECSEFLMKRGNGMNEWVPQSDFHQPRLIVAQKDVVFLGISNNRFTQGETYSVFQQNNDSFFTIDDNGDGRIDVSYEGFKNAKEFKPTDIEEYQVQLKEKEALKKSEREAREIQRREYQREKEEKERQKSLEQKKRREKWFYPKIDIVFIVLGCTLDAFKILDVYSFLFLFIPLLSVNCVFIYQSLLSKQQKKSTVELQERNRLLSLLNTETTLHIKAIESKSALLKRSEFVSGVWLDTILDYICLTISGSVYEGKILESCEEKINEFLTACDNYLDTISKDVATREEYVKTTIENQANALIAEKTEIIRNVTQDIEQTIGK